ncbi:MAG: hypothetical protein KF703_00600 [Actinobacteria bacterium]|nr:hypothetical protein [Actinomycetota bacterium]
MRWLATRPPFLLVAPVTGWCQGIETFGPPEGAPDNDGELGISVVPGTKGRVTIEYLVVPYERMVIVKPIG